MNYVGMCVHIEIKTKLHALRKITAGSNIAVENLYERVNFGHLGTQGRIILKLMEEKQQTSQEKKTKVKSVSQT
jgi:hypothetical protein